MTESPAPTSAQVRGRLVETPRRDLIGPGPQDTDLARERLKEKPSGWYVTGYLAPLPEPDGPSAETAEQDGLFDEGDPQVGDDRGADSDTGPARAADDAPDDEAPVVRIRAPSSVGLTVGGIAVLRQQVEQLIDIWVRLAADATENGGRLYYGYPVGDALCCDPLSPLLRANGPEYERFKRCAVHARCRARLIGRDSRSFRKRAYLKGTGMAENQIRLSQLMGYYGPGAMLDLPDRSVLVMGLDDWDQRGGAFRLIDEPRLSRLLRLRLEGESRLATSGDPQLRTPPQRRASCSQSNLAACR